MPGISTRVMRLTVLMAFVTASLVIPATQAQATYHLMKIRQIHPSAGVLGGEWVELQMYADGQNQVTGKLIRTFGTGGEPMTNYTIPSNAGSGQNQRTILISSLFTPAGVNADFVAPVAQLQMTGQDGAVCFTENDPPTYTPIDCVSYGNFTGTLPAGTPAVATPFESTLERKITPNCPTSLENADDTNNSATDFALSSRPPRNNATAPTEKLCDAGAPPPGSNFRCRGKRATLIGTSANNDIKGTNQRDVIVAFGGKDKVNGRGGNDFICGLGGKDTLKGAAGKDVLVGGAGGDKLIGGAGKDTLIGQKGNDVCSGGAKADEAKTCETTRTI
jgi:hypothetical protein